MVSNRLKSTKIESIIIIFKQFNLLINDHNESCLIQLKLNLMRFNETHILIYR